jgi:excinuclease UvrABC ATPase subunit
LIKVARANLDMRFDVPCIGEDTIKAMAEYGGRCVVLEAGKVIIIDQSPIGRTPRSNPATYTKVFDDIRKVFAETKDAKVRGYSPGRFSFNLKGGRCETCQGGGLIKIEMKILH